MIKGVDETAEFTEEQYRFLQSREVISFNYKTNVCELRDSALKLCSRPAPYFIWWEGEDVDGVWVCSEHFTMLRRSEGNDGTV